VLACWFGVDRSTITRAVAEVRPLLAERGCAVSPGVRLRTLAGVVDRLGADGRTGIIDVSLPTTHELVRPRNLPLDFLPAIPGIRQSAS